MQEINEALLSRWQHLFLQCYAVYMTENIAAGVPGQCLLLSHQTNCAAIGLSRVSQPFSGLPQQQQP
jgi:hypothetical protein